MGRIKITRNDPETSSFHVGGKGGNKYIDLGKIELCTDEEGPDFIRLSDIVELCQGIDHSRIHVVGNQDGVDVYELCEDSQDS